jgi:hypothetical protein
MVANTEWGGRIKAGENDMKTKDIYLAATLISLGHKIEQVDKTDLKHMEFTIIPANFDSPNIPPVMSYDLENLAILYANDELRVSPLKYKDALQRLKSIVHSS